MTPEQAKAAAGSSIKMIDITSLSHFAQLVRQSKERYEAHYQIPFCDEWFTLPSNDYNPGLAYAGMGICLSGYKNLPSNQYRYIRGSLAAVGCTDIDITSYYHLNDENYIAAEDNVDVISYAMGHRTVKDPAVPGGQKELVIVMVRGTSVSVEWASNSNVANSVADGNYDMQYHEGFLKSAQGALSGVKKYLAAHDIDPETSVMWIIAHSRGAAIANVLAALVNEDTAMGFPKERVYSYNFSASPGTRRTDANGPGFDNIFNIMNPEDYIARIPPPEWGFRRFGTDMYFPSIATNYTDYRRWRAAFLKQFKEWTRVDFPAFHGNAQTAAWERMIHDISPNAADMYCRERYTQDGTITYAQYFRIFTLTAGQRGKDLVHDVEDLVKYGHSMFEQFLAYLIENQVLGHVAPGAHQEEGYLAKFMLCYEMGIDLTRPELMTSCDTRRFTVYGPVLLEVRDADGNVVARVDRGKIDTDLYDDPEGNFIAMYYDNEVDATQVWVPKQGGYTVQIQAQKSGPHDVAIADLTPMGDTIRQEFYADVALTAGKAVNWDDVKPAQPTHVSAPGNDLNVDIVVDGKLSDAGLSDDEHVTCDEVRHYGPGGGKMLNGWAEYGDSILGFSKDQVVADALTVRRATYGDHVAVYAYCDKDMMFRGWYTQSQDPAHGGGEPLCRDEKYVFRIEGDRSLVAWFEAK